MLVTVLALGAVMGIWIAMVAFRTGSVALTSGRRLTGKPAKVAASVCLVFGLLCLMAAIGLLLGLLQI